MLGTKWVKKILLTFIGILALGSVLIYTLIGTDAGSQAAGAFLGAFSAFTFGLFALYFQHVFSRGIRYLEALVTINADMNHNYNRLGKTVFLLQGLVDGLANPERLQTLTFPTFKYTELLSKEILNNEVMNLNYRINEDLHAFEVDLRTLVTSYNEVKTLLLAGQLTENGLKGSFAFIESGAKTLMAAIEETTERIEDIIAHSRVLMRSDNSLRGILFQAGATKEQHWAMFKLEKHKLKSEVAQVLEASIAELQTRKNKLENDDS